VAVPCHQERFALYTVTKKVKTGLVESRCCIKTSLTPRDTSLVRSVAADRRVARSVTRLIVEI
jgi:hypothetical protein